jgi:hypothetical protein
MEWLLAVALKPLILFLGLCVVYVLARSMHRFIPEGRVKQLLYDRSLRARHPWKFGLGFAITGYATIAVIAYLVYAR